MPFSSVLGASSVIKPGVCTSTTRPSVPYTGQLIFETDTSRLAVWTGSAWQYETAAAGPPGLVYIAGASFSAVSSVSFPTNTFTSTYQNYKVTIQLTASSATQTLSMRVNSAGSAVSGSLYFQSRMELNAAGSYLEIEDSSQTSVNINRVRGANILGNNTFDVFNPADSTLVTSWTFTGHGEAVSGNSSPTVGGGWYNSAASHDGLNFFVAGTMSGYYRVYGYTDS